ncbi:TPA: Holliday junction branch migration protein RuvA [Candidatus Gracilibacteria bacterium]|nr:Holliday junction branch migration protein RuvA [Candidatus Gracilibacteria bacterium]HIQ57312.1 Holliday junction branch migration protein RuvA [Candidatus Gracilibacteria bacterium]
MIAFIKGTVFKKNENEKSSSVLIDVHSVGYQVFLPNRILSKYVKNDKIFLYTFHRIGENVNDLYGMETQEELEFFETLLSVSGIGPKSALLMSEMSFSDIEKAIEQEDIKFLTKVPGVGKKTASRMILELKGKLPTIVSDEKDGNNVEKNRNRSNNQKLEKYSDIKLMLESLGFAKRNIQELFETAEFISEISDASDEKIVKIALQNL